MSSRRGSDKKTNVEETGDSGYLSGQISEQLSGPVSEQLPGQISEQKPDQISEQFSSLSLASTSESDRKNVDSSYQHDSGFISGDITNVSGEVKTEIPSQIRLVPKLDPHKLIPFLIQQDEDGDTQLHIAAVHGCQRSISALLRICPDKAWINLPNDYRHTALHLAVMSQNATVARMLVIAGASLDARDLAGQTPVHIATDLQSIQCLHALLTPLSITTRSSSSKKHRNHVLNEINYDGQTCAHLATSAGNVEVLKTLIHYGADINAREGHAGWTPLHLAARRRDVPLIKYLLSCSGLAPHTRDYAQRTPRRLARRYHVEHAFTKLPHTDSDFDSDTDDDDQCCHDSDNEAFFESLTKGAQMMQVA